MKAFILVLALGTGGLLSVRVADCRCGLVCRCGVAERAPAPAGTPSGCCHGDAEAPLPGQKPHEEPDCTHVEPPGAILQPEMSPPPAASEAVPLGIPGPVMPPPRTPGGTDGAPCPIRGSPPLYLLHSVLLI